MRIDKGNNHRFMKYLMPILIFIICFGVQAQEEEFEESGRIHKVALVLGMTHVPSTIEEGGESSEEFVPTLGLDYFLQFKKGWKVGLVVDYEFANYIVKFGREDLNREGALVTGILLGYEFANRWSVLLGPGVEFEKNKNIAILRTSVEYEFELGENWGLFPSVNYDFKQEYSTWSLNVGISTRL